MHVVKTNVTRNFAKLVANPVVVVAVLHARIVRCVVSQCVRYVPLYVLVNANPNVVDVKTGNVVVAITVVQIVN